MKRKSDSALFILLAVWALSWCTGPAFALTQVKQVTLRPYDTQVHRIKINSSTACSITLPKKIKGIILGNSLDFIAERVSDFIVSVKPKTEVQNLFTNLQLILDERWILTIEIETTDQDNAVSQLIFSEEGKDLAGEELAKKKSDLEKSFQLKEQALTANLETKEENNYIKDMLESYRYVKLDGEKQTDGITMTLKDATIRNNNRTYMKVRLHNKSDLAYRVAQIEILDRTEGGFLRRGTKGENALPSKLSCLQNALEIQPRQSLDCVVAFDLPAKQSSKRQIGVRLVEAANPSRKVFIRRVLELYER
jgi:hypothetical protein